MKKKTVDYAIEYQKRFKFSIHPVNHKKKTPLIKWKAYQTKKAEPDQIEKWFLKYPDAAIGIITGKLSGVFVIDCDTADGYQAVMNLIPDNTIIPTVKTPRGHHLYFKYPEGSSLSTYKGILPGVDYRGEGGYVVCPPSVNGNGGQYTWIEGQSLKEIDPQEIPKAMLDLLLSKSKKKLDKTKPAAHKEIPSEYNGKPTFAMITNEIIKSPAFKKLTNTARTAFTLLRAQVRKSTQAMVIYPYTQAAPDYMTQDSFKKSIKQLSELGFIEIKQVGGKYRKTNHYYFIEKWRDIEDEEK